MKDNFSVLVSREQTNIDPNVFKVSYAWIQLISHSETENSFKDLQTQDFI